MRSLIPPVLGEWEHYAIAFDIAADHVTVYKNGFIARTGPYNFAGPDNDPWMFAHNQDPANQNDSFNGLYDDMRIYDRLLTPDDVEALYIVPEPTTFTLVLLGALPLLGHVFRRQWRKEQ